uniref:Putative translation initiation factor if-2 n=1 Tax=Amblyomma cajennense TaxID=34607 RepID=A0A023FC60_AMBCJ
MTKAQGLSWLQLPVTILLLSNPWYLLLARGQNCPQATCHTDYQCAPSCTCVPAQEGMGGVCVSADLQASHQHQFIYTGDSFGRNYDTGGDFGYPQESPALTGANLAQSLTSELTDVVQQTRYPAQAQQMPSTPSQPPPSSPTSTQTKDTLPLSATGSKPSGIPDSPSASRPPPPKSPGTGFSGRPRPAPSQAGPVRRPFPGSRPQLRPVGRRPFRVNFRGR